MHCDCAGSHKTVVTVVVRLFPFKFPYRMAQARTKRGPRRCPRSFFVQFTHKMAWMICPGAFPLCKLAQNKSSFTEILPRGSLSRDLAKTQGPLYRELCAKILPRDLLQRSVQTQRELIYRALVHRSCQEASDRFLVQRPGEESKDLPRR